MLILTQCDDDDDDDDGCGATVIVLNCACVCGLIERLVREGSPWELSPVHAKGACTSQLYFALSAVTEGVWSFLYRLWLPMGHAHAKRSEVFF